MDTINNQNYLVQEKLSTLMFKYAVPCISSLLVAALYNICDQLFIANASYLGSYGNAANNVVYPLTVVALAIAVMIGDGCCAFVSISLGQQNRTKARKSVGNAIVLTLICGVVLTAVYALFQTPIINAFGGGINQETFHQAQIYFTYITIGIPFYMFGQAMNPIIRSDGSPKFAMISNIAGAIVNIILDPIFIYVFKWGMMGAALATILGQILTAIVAVWYMMHFKSVQLDKDSFKLSFNTIRSFLPLGICSFLAQISMVFSMLAINNMVQKYGAQDPIFGLEEYAQIPMAVIGIVMKVFQVVISVVIGMASGCIPVVGYNVGANRKDRVRQLFIYLLAAETIVGIIAFIIVQVFPEQLIGLFGAANESVYYTEFAIKSFRTYLCMIILACINKATFIYLQALGNAVLSTVLSMVRELIFGVGFALLLPVFFGLDGVLYSMPVSDVLTFIISVVAIIYTLRSLKTNEKSEA